MKTDVQTPPGYCQYADGPCDHIFAKDELGSQAFFLYASRPQHLAATIDAAKSRLEQMSPDKVWKSWRSLPVTGQIVFCEICKSMRFAEAIVADVTTLNFNLLFEIGFTIGLGIPVIPIRDTTYVSSKREFDELGLLDTLGYVDFANSEELAKRVLERMSDISRLPASAGKLFVETPLYVLKGHINTEGAVKLMSTLKKSGLRFRSYDPIETPRLSLLEARRQVGGSVGVVAHLLSQHRQGAVVHNALCALICGVAMAQQKVVVMLQEEASEQPVDYRDVVQTYNVPDQIPALLERPIRAVVEKMQLATPELFKHSEKVLELVDIGDPAAENEINGLRSYFVPTGQFSQARRGHSRLVVGRKGTGKTAIFYEIRNSFRGGHSTVVLDLKPEGHQFTKLRETVLSKMSPGLQEHTMTAFWNYILLVEIAHKIIERERSYAQRHQERWQKYLELEKVYREHDLASDDDLSQRLLRQVDRISERYGGIDSSKIGGRITDLIYRVDIFGLNESVSRYLQEKESVWLLIDNLDKGWPSRGSTPEDILIIRSLMDAERKLQRQLEERGVEMNCLLFIRTDIYEHLLVETPDKGKDTAIRLDWDDPELFREIVLRRIQVSTPLNGSFHDVWPILFDSHVATEDSFNFMLERTLMRPRDLLTFVQRSIQVALNRGHGKVTANDILQAEASYSEDMVLMMGFEIADTQSIFADVVYAFQGADIKLSKQEVGRLLLNSNIGQEHVDKAIELLTWFGFLGVASGDINDAKYSYQVRYNLRQLLLPIQKGEAVFIIHPAFRRALGVR